VQSRSPAGDRRTEKPGCRMRCDRERAARERADLNAPRFICESGSKGSEINQGRAAATPPMAILPNTNGTSEATDIVCASKVSGMRCPQKPSSMSRIDSIRPRFATGGPGLWPERKLIMSDVSCPAWGDSCFRQIVQFVASQLITPLGLEWVSELARREGTRPV